MLVVDVNALLTVNFLYLRRDVRTNALAAVNIVINSTDAKYIMRIQSTGGKLLAFVNMVAVVYKNTCRVRHRVNTGLALFRSVDRNVVHYALLCFVDSHRAGNF